jgi:hypothetical protein
MWRANGPLPLDELVALMKKDDLSLGWSAVAAYDRTKANRLLAQEFEVRYQTAPQWRGVHAAG